MLFAVLSGMNNSFLHAPTLVFSQAVASGSTLHCTPAQIAAAAAWEDVGRGQGRLSRSTTMPYRTLDGEKVAGGGAAGTNQVADIILHYMPFFMM